jgi:hypothetical protein
MDLGFSVMAFACHSLKKDACGVALRALALVLAAGIGSGMSPISICQCCDSATTVRLLARTGRRGSLSEDSLDETTKGRACEPSL